mgnify:CR=1 FL=1
MKLLIALISAAFLSTTLGSIIYSESAVAEQKVDCAVSWNKQKDQVKGVDRRKYIGCLEEYVKDQRPLGKKDKFCKVKWNEKKDQVKGVDRRKYIACLENIFASIPKQPNLICPDGSQRESSADNCGLGLDGTTQFCKDGVTYKAFSGDQC